LLVSIITVVFNDRQNLSKTIDSVSSQIFKDFEYIVIDGASTDGTQELIQQNENKISHWLSEKDQGIYDAMNKGITLAKGEYVYFLNAGDTLYEKKTLAYIANDLKSENNLYLFNVLTDNGKLIKPNNLLLFFPYKLPTYHQGIVYPKNVLTKVPFDSSWKLIADYINFLQIKKEVSFLPCNIIISIYDTKGVSSDQNLLNQEMYKYYLSKKHYLYYIIRKVISFIKSVKKI
jgi:glycosyltransferase involved in cell wall biosynthesis